MPLIQIEYDDQIVNDYDANAISKAAQKVVAEVTGISDVFVYANCSRIRVAAAPIEIFVRISEYKVTDEKELMHKIKSVLSAWKQSTDFPHKVNLSLIPMHWLVEIDI